MVIPQVDTTLPAIACQADGGVFLKQCVRQMIQLPLPSPSLLQAQAHGSNPTKRRGSTLQADSHQHSFYRR